MPRDSSGNYTLPLGNPVIDGTVIDVNWANPTMNDIAVQLNNVVTRDGLLGFTSPAFFVDGTPALPGIAFAAQNGTGLWRDSTKVGISYAGISKQAWNAAGSEIAGGLKATSFEAVDSIAVGTGTTTGTPFIELGNQRIGEGSSFIDFHSHPGGADFDTRVIKFDNANTGAFRIDNLLGSIEIFNRGAFPIVFSTTDTVRMRINADGFVGIGTATPESLLEIQETSSGVSTTTLVLSNKGTAAQTATRMIFACSPSVASARGAYIEAINVSGSGSGSRHDLAFGANPSSAVAFECMRINGSTGNVAIGIPSATNYGATNRALSIGAPAPGAGILDLWINGARQGVIAPGAGTFEFDTVGVVALVFKTNSTEKLRITDDGRLYGKTLHNNAGSVTGATNQYIASGTYIPVVSPTTNLTTFTVQTGMWSRVGNVVTVSARGSIRATVAATNVLGTMTLPIASALVGDADLAGALATTSGACLEVYAEVATDLARVIGPLPNTNLLDYTLTFQYVVR